MKLFAAFLLSITGFFLHAQDTSQLSFTHFYQQVLSYHPVISQANTLTQQARAELRSARGAFDPAVDLSYQNKTSAGKNAYTYFTPQLKIPTLPGVDIKTGIEQSSGSNLNPELSKFDATNNTFNGYTMVYGGVSVPVGRGLFIDARRSTLRQAELLQQINEAERIKIINKLLLEAAKAYWDWNLAYEKLMLMQTNLNVARQRLNFINSRIKLGEEKAIDSVEASIEFQRREVLMLEARVEFVNAGYELSNFLWGTNQVPMQLEKGVVPATSPVIRISITADSLAQLVQFAGNQHPELVKQENKLKQLEIERRLAAENLKPQLNLNYYPFRSYNMSGQPDGVNNIFGNNYKLGIEFYSSLFLRKERGKLASVKYKIRQNELELLYTRRELSNAVMSAYNDMDNLGRLLGIQEYLTNSANTLRNAEEVRFESGESSLFLVNTRERSLIEAQVKLAELKAKYIKSQMILQWSSGIRLMQP